jgi:DNA-binding beta-propeller fold protein YncE
MRLHTSQISLTASCRRRGAGVGAGLLVGAFLASIALLVSVPVASADLSFGPQGTGAGQTDEPSGVAVDASNGDLYVVDTQNNRVDVFESSGVFLFAFGWKVNATTPEEKLQTCTVLTGCQQGSPGAGAGQLNGPALEPSTGLRGTVGIAVDGGSHDVYVAEEGNGRVQAFDASGAFLFMFGKNVNTGTSGKPDLCTDAGSPTNVCGVGSEGGGVGEFDSIKGIGVGSGGAVYVADTRRVGPCAIAAVGGGEFSKRVQRFDSSGEATEQISLTGTPCGQVNAFAVDPGGDLYVGNIGESGAVRKYDSAGSPVVGWGEGGKVDSSFNISAVALDATGDLFVADNSGLDHLQATGILEYDSSGAQLRVFYGSRVEEVGVTGLAAYHTGTSDVFATQREGVQQVAFPSPGPVGLPGCKATGIGNSRATFTCQVNPENQATEYRFQYVDDATFQHDVAESGAGHGFDHAKATVLEAIPAPGGSSFNVQSVSKQLPLESLAPETAYHFRLLASNADAPTGNPGPEGPVFTTLGPPEVLASWASDVGTDSARVHAEVNPLLLATTGYFQYVDDATYRADVEALGPGHGFDHALVAPDVSGGASPIDFGHGEGAVAGVVQLYPLAPGTVYHYRLVAQDPFAPVFGPERTLRTFGLSGAGDEACSNQAFRVGASAVLPDCRAFELVSPLEKDNGDIRTLRNVTGYPTGLDQSSVAGAGFTYSSARAFAEPQSAPYTNQYLARRDPERGWVSEALDPPRSGQFVANELEDEYKAFSPDLSSGWLLQEGEPTLAPCAPTGFADLYRRENASGAYEPLSCAQPNLKSRLFEPELEGFSTDGSRAVVRVDDALTFDASSATVGTGQEERPVYQVYESTGAGELRLVSVLPDGEASDKDAGAGSSLENVLRNKYRFQSVVHAVSADGSRVFWSASSGGSGQIYLRENADREQSLDGGCDEPEKACTIPVSESVTNDNVLFQTASVDGTKAIFTVEAGPLKGNLYEFDVATEQSHLIAEKTLIYILGSSEDASRIYFASEEASVQAQSEGAVKGQPNVYFDDGGTIRFIGALSSADLSDPYGSPIDESVSRTARVSPDGLHLVFMSNSKALSEHVAGYDNTDVANGEADAEVYQYDATANSGLGKLRCVSCDPTGARPQEGRELLSVGGTGANKDQDPWAAARVPGFETDLYQPRYLSDDGNRVYFDSYDALVARDTNGKGDVYQWEAAGTGSCATGSPSYVVSSEGCLDLISSGQSHEDSEFLDATSSGSDVFFTTGESLLPYDPGLIDIYDARIGGGFPPPVSPPVVCEGEACQGAPVPLLNSTPASFAFSGPGNPAPSVLATPKAKIQPKVKPCRKGTVRKKGKCVIVKKKKKKGLSVKTGKSSGKSSRTVKRNRGAAR